MDFCRCTSMNIDGNVCKILSWKKFARRPLARAWEGKSIGIRRESSRDLWEYVACTIQLCLSCACNPVLESRISNRRHMIIVWLNVNGFTLFPGIYTSRECLFRRRFTTGVSSRGSHDACLRNRLFARLNLTTVWDAFRTMGVCGVRWYFD